MNIFSRTQLTMPLVLILLLAGTSAVHAQSAQSQPSQTAVATFAGGCFWCMEPPYDKLEGVLSTTSGYIGGSIQNPSYEQVSSGGTGHAEAVQVEYNPEQVSYEQLLTVFWRNIDPLDAGGQFCDRGSQYRSAIFYHNDEQQRLAEASRERLDSQADLPGPIVTEIVAAQADDFYRAEGYHQNYYQERSLRYKFYRWNCGRDERLEELWQDD
ncbi:peptide-methionine (S)-S-oxide reductase [Pseudohongiella acticola]|uniref:Peptide methionine sulfoxide reductase MsrA n=1 Tax=Pseudohongiella acticola TaxID=1524254 RepID=A0A1E8CME0_9GAMM|nr:peptide-methionine (S)-S-oxide reductase MsrA [Pseudohongiella acticola]OFE13563.1 peptide-methionine (S)-S-oxide reductase [Pseudohongiella acticola]